MEFTPSAPLSLGMEMEFQLLDTSSLDLAYCAPVILRKLTEDEHIKAEYQENTIEVTSGICSRAEDLQKDIVRKVAVVMRTCDQFGVKLCGAGTHPFSTALAIITPSPRYLYMKKTEGYLSRTQITFATHIHIGMPDGETVIRVMRELKAFLPLFVGLSASSPYWRGHDTKFASYRHRILAATRSYGIPPSFSSWDEFCTFAECMARAGVFPTINDIHWDIRPRPHLGTIEIRTMDVQATVARAAALAAFVRAVTLYLEGTRRSDRPATLPVPLHWWLEKENHYQASHLGLSAKYIRNNAGDSCSLSSIFDDVLSEIKGIVRDDGEQHYLDTLQAAVEEDLGYIRQRRIFESTGSLKTILRELSRDLEQEVRESGRTCD